MIKKLDGGVGGRLTSWLFKERGPGVELGTIEKNPHTVAVGWRIYFKQ